MNMEIKQKVIEILSEHLGVAAEEIKEESYLQDDLNSDPLTLADIVISLEDTFSIEIPPQESSKFRTCGDIINYIADSLGEI